LVLVVVGIWEGGIARESECFRESIQIIIVELASHSSAWFLAAAIFSSVILNSAAVGKGGGEAAWPSSSLPSKIRVETDG
jgi:hypothetical protein